MIKRVLSYGKPYQKQAWLAILAIFIEVACEVVQPMLMAGIIDKGIPNKDLNYIIQQGLLMVVLSLIALVTGAIGARYAAAAGTSLAYRMRQLQMEKIQQFSFHNIDHFSNASLVTRLTTDVSSLQNTAIITLRILARAPIMILSTLFLIVQINAQLSIVLLVAMPFLALSLGVILKIAFPRFYQVQLALDKINRTLQENFIGIRVVKAYVREDFEREKFNTENTNFKKRALFAMNTVMFNNPLMQLTVYSCTIAIMWFGGNFAIEGVMSTGNLVSYIAYIGQLMMSLMMISFVFIMFTMTKASIQRVFEVLDTNVDIVEPTHAKTIEKINGDVKFENVVFSYEKDSQEQVLSNISFTIEQGKVLGIIGPTGSGKTSLVQLIPRLYDVSSGQVFVGGQNVKEYTFDTLRQQVAMVLQKNTLFSGTIKENLLWGNPNATDQELEQAAKYAQAHDFIMALPNGYHSIVEQGGNNFSGGQKQRLCIARAMVRKPAVLILDDSTSAVDTTTDSQIREAFFNHLPNTTVIIIAQRISSIQGADKIIVLNDGQIDGIGTHDELMQSNQMYQDIYTTQLEGVSGHE